MPNLRMLELFLWISSVSFIRGHTPKIESSNRDI